jgi:hypothetical protein
MRRLTRRRARFGCPRVHRTIVATGLQGEATPWAVQPRIVLEELRRLKSLEEENKRLKSLVADLSLDK